MSEEILVTDILNILCDSGEFLLHVRSLGDLLNFQEDSGIQNGHDDEGENEPEDDWHDIGHRIEIVPHQTSAPVVEVQDEVGRGRVQEPEPQSEDPSAHIG